MPDRLRAGPEGAKLLGAREVEPAGLLLRVSYWRLFPGPNPGRPQAPAHARHP